MLDIAVLFGAVLVALAAALVLQTQFGLGWELSAVAGLAVFAIAATLHILLRRTEEIGRLKAQIGTMERELGIAAERYCSKTRTASAARLH